ncbi:MAG: ribonuclease III [Oscillospiraceae bacterium]|nr:ribonuclease III [Oscillospiraceae bacterium]
MEKLQATLCYRFKNPEILQNALTHSSYSNENRITSGSNERLEFLGDSVLSLVVSDYLYRQFAHLPEGELTKLRASLVCEKTLCRFAKSLDLGGYLLFGKGEKNTGGGERPSILADAFEAVLAAVYLDGGMEEASRLVMFHVKHELKSRSGAITDYKTALQEVIQKNPDSHVDYVQTDETGPDHDKMFTVEVRLGGEVIGIGQGRSKKNAEQAAAMEALKHL